MRISDWSSDVCSSDLRDLGAAIAGLGHEVRIGGAGLRDVRAPHHQEPGIVPVGAFGNVGLFAPGLRAGGRQVAIPVVETHADRKSVVEGKSVSVRVDLGGRRSIKKKTNKSNNRQQEKKHKKNE